MKPMALGAGLLVRASHRYHEVTGSNPVEVLTFSGFYIRNCINWGHNCKDHSLLDFTSAVWYIWNISYIAFHMMISEWQLRPCMCISLCAEVSSLNTGHMPSKRLDFKQVDTSPISILKKSKIFMAKSTS